MAKTSVEDLKARFKRGMFPTEGDFANVFDSYVHKDDGIDINDVTAENGSKTLTTLLQEFKEEILQDAKDQETQYDDTELKGKVEANEGNISSLEGRVSANEGDISSLDGRVSANEGNISSLEGRVSTNEGNISSLESRVSTNEGDISTLKDDLDTAEDFIAGHESRIQALEERTEVPEGLADFIEKVNSFLEDADASDATINKWKEIEAFLNGITDTETLTGLLANLKEEILGEIPEQKEYTAGDGIEISEDGVISLKEDENKLDCVKVIADLDASEAPTGTIAIYTGESNEKYTHGFMYEKKGEGGTVIPAGSPLSVTLGGFTNSRLYGKQIVNTGRMVDLQPWADKCPSWGGVDDKLAQVVTKTGSTMGYEAVTYDGSLVIYYAPMDRNNYLAFYDGVESMSYGFDQLSSSIPNTLFASAVTDHDIILPEGDGAPSWTPLNVMNVIG